MYIIIFHASGAFSEVETVIFMLELDYSLLILFSYLVNGRSFQNFNLKLSFKLIGQVQNRYLYWYITTNFPSLLF